MRRLARAANESTCEEGLDMKNAMVAGGNCLPFGIFYSSLKR
jgi:hypothetical protein